jgi:hypothetical protein
VTDSVASKERNLDGAVREGTDCDGGTGISPWLGKECQKVVVIVLEVLTVSGLTRSLRG